ncbi:MAG TPA: sugar nucleotide-binding protein [Pirellulales bacterium]|jgi:dTDP-4-dehydrorhamnose reductase|nr:sugar nucleotide-binding protein [Pirellulales bacterium]
MFRSALDATPPLPLLITGAAGVAGYNALAYFQARYPGQVIGIRQQDNWRLSGPDIVACNAEDRAGLETLFDRYKFASVLDCAGNCALKACELDPAMAWRINVEGADNLVGFAAAHGSRLVHLSIDLVFSGSGQGAHVETDPTDPVTVYGKTMVAAEQLIAQAYPEACVLRISLPMGISFNGHAGAIDWIQSRFRKSKPATLYFDEVRTPTYTDCLNRLCEVVLANDLQGLFHAGGPRPLSLYNIAQIINRVGGYRPQDLMGCQRLEAGPIPPRAGNVSLNSSKLREAIGYEPFHAWPYDDALVPTDPEWHFERHANERGGPEWLAEVLYRNPLRA